MDRNERPERAKQTSQNQGRKTVVDVPYTPLVAGSQINLWICSPRRTFKPSLRIHSARSMGSSWQFDVSRCVLGVLRKTGEKITLATLLSSRCSRVNSRANS